MTLPRLRTTHLVVPAYLLLTLILTWPLAREFGRSLPAVYGAGDALLQAFILGWDFQAMARNPLEIFNAPNFHPHVRTLTYMDHLIGPAVVAWPVHALTGRVAAAINFLIVVSFVASAWAVYRLLRLESVSRAGSFLGGFLFAFSVYRFSHLGMLNQTQTQFLPLGLYFILRWFRTPHFRHLAAAAAVIVMQAWSGWYYAFYLVLSLILLVVWQSAAGGIAWRRVGLWRAGVLAVVTGLLILPGVWPYLEQQRAMPGFKRTLGMTLLYTGDLLDYMKLNVDNWLARRFTWLGSDVGCFPGVVTLILALVAAGAGRAARTKGISGHRKVAEPATRHESRAPSSNWLTVRLARGFWARFRMLAKRSGVRGYFALLALFSLIMSLGPLPHVAGRRFPIPLPYAAAYFIIPGFASLRVPGRWAVLVTLSLAILAGYGFDVLTRLNERRRNGEAHQKADNSRRTRVLFAAALGLALLTSWSVPIPMVTFPSPDAMPAVYQWLARQPGDFAILDLPMPARESDESPIDGARQIYGLYHGKRRLDGLSGFVPPDYHVFRMVMQGFPRPGTIRAAREMGARYIIFHYGDLPPEERRSLEAAAEASPAIDVAGRFGDDVVYEIVAR